LPCSLGSRVWPSELTAGFVLLTGVGGGVRQVGLAHLLAHSSTRLLTDIPVDAVAGVGADLGRVAVCWKCENLSSMQ